MSNIQCRFMTQEDVDKEFKDHIEVDPNTKCWNWKPKNFRFRHDLLFYNPRRYAVQMAGYVIPRGRNVMPGCCNPKCVNPEHTRLKHDGSKIDKGNTLYYDLGAFKKADPENLNDEDDPNFGTDFRYSAKFLAKKYHVTREQAARARKDTLKLIVEVKRSRLPLQRLANQYNVAPSYISQIKALSLRAFEEFKMDTSEDLHDDEHVDPAGLKFKLD